MSQTEFGKSIEFISVDDQLEKRWNIFSDRLNIPNNNYFEDIIQHYSEPNRAYHNQKHILNSLKEFDLIKNKDHNLKFGTVEMAIWYHDVIYDVSANDNEEKSAKYAKLKCEEMNLPKAFIEDVQSLILATKHNNLNVSQNAKYLMDIDLVSLGKPADIFDKYDDQIFTEYSSVYSKEDYQKGRAEFFKSMLDRPFIYSTKYFQDKYEEQARENLNRSYTKLVKL